VGLIPFSTAGSDVTQPDRVPGVVRQFISDHLSSIEQLEVLLLLHRTAPAVWSAAAISTELRSSLSSITRRLVDLQSEGLVKGGAADGFSCDERSQDTVVALAEAYRVWPYAVIDLIATSQAARSGAKGPRRGP
jgi:hypothetical protein